MSKVLSPAVSRDPLADAFRQATDKLEPIFVPAAVHVDDRGWSIMNQMQGVMGPGGQVNYSVVYPHVIKAWHRHNKQTDFWFAVGGHIKVGVYRENDDQLWSIVVGERKPGVLIIPPPLWHGLAAVGHEPAAMFYYVTHQYNPNEPDEWRRGHDSVAAMNWTVEHR